MTNTSNEEVVYEINVQDIQDVAKKVLERRLTKREVGLVKGSVGNYVDWFQAIENSIREHGCK
jgi:hypothetical protein